MLAILQLMFHLQWFYMTRNPLLLFTVYSDSESLIKRLQKSLSLTYLVPRRTLFSESDVEMQILDALAAFPNRLALVHVEGHQDEKYPDRPVS
jgi:cytosine/adenosine deaminase-related metal-dependent hydrolase